MKPPSGNTAVLLNSNSMAPPQEMDDGAMAQVARDVLNMPRKSAKVEDETFRSFFGASVSIVTLLWNMLVPLIDQRGAAPKHLLWALVFIKVYSTTAVHRRIVGWPDPKTYRKWSWYFLKKIASLKSNVIKLDKRFEGYDGKATCLISVDGVDCMVHEPWPFNKKWYSQKFNGPAVKYEVGVCIKTGFIVWTFGPHMGGALDGEIFKKQLDGLLADDEGVEVDAGYKGSSRFKAPIVATSRADRKAKSVVRGRHENVNGRLKIYDMLNVPFRHTKPRNEMMTKHGWCFDSIAVITQLKFENGDSLLYDVDYDVNYD